MEMSSSSSEPIRAAQQDLAQAIKTIVSLLEEDPTVNVLDPRDGVTQTDVVVTATALLRAADVEIFELALWQSWGIPGGPPAPTNGVDARL